MTKPKFIFFKIALAAVFVCSFAAVSFSQTTARQQQSEPNYEVVLQVLAASNSPNDKAAAVAPPSFSSVVKRLKTMYSFSSYRLDLTYLQRVANTGNFVFKGVLTSANQDVYAPIFSNFSIEQLAVLPDAGERNSVSISGFQFGERVPVKTGGFADENGKSNAVINYEQVGLSMRRIDLPVNTPTVIGNLSASKPDEMMFLILTVKPAGE